MYVQVYVYDYVIFKVCVVLFSVSVSLLISLFSLVRLVISVGVRMMCVLEVCMISLWCCVCCM